MVAAPRNAAWKRSRQLTKYHRKFLLLSINVGQLARVTHVTIQKFRDAVIEFFVLIEESEEPQNALFCSAIFLLFCREFYDCFEVFC